MNAPEVLINEVGPRDGLQNQAKILSLPERRQLIDALVAAGLRAVEVGSFVSPAAVPAMAGTGELLESLGGSGAVEFSVLIPNAKGYELARAAGARSVAVVLSATETMNQRNINMSLEKATAVCEDLVRRAAQDGLASRAYLAVAFECPYEGRVDPAVAMALARRLVAAGASDLIVADTIGAADPAAVQRLLRDLVAEHGADRLSCHFHDTRGMAVANVYAALERGIRRFDSSIGGLGGCPFAPGASGNVATEDVVLMLEQMGIGTGIDMERLLEVVELASRLTGNCHGGHAHRWLKLRKRR